MNFFCSFIIVLFAILINIPNEEKYNINSVYICLFFAVIYIQLEIIYILKAKDKSK